MGIKNLVPRLPERGKIKIGRLGQERKTRDGKNTYRLPQKLDHFTITKTERGQDGNFIRDAEAHAEFGEKPTELPVRLLYDDPDLNFPTRYAAYKGRTLWCSGDGDVAQRLTEDGKGRHQVACPCERADPAYQGDDKCKMNGKLSVLLDIPNRPGVGGVWTLRTTSYNTIVGILSSLQFLRALTGGPLANIPMTLRIQAKEGTTPSGTTQKVYFVSIESRGSEEELIERGQQVALHRATAKVSIEHIEERARQALQLASPDVILPGDETENVVDEFYPEQAGDTPTPPPRPQLTDDESSWGEDDEAGRRRIRQEALADHAAKSELALYDIVSENGDTLAPRTADEWRAYIGRLATNPAALLAFFEHNEETVLGLEHDGEDMSELRGLVDAARSLSRSDDGDAEQGDLPTEPDQGKPKARKSKPPAGLTEGAARKFLARPVYGYFAPFDDHGRKAGITWDVWRAHLTSIIGYADLEQLDKLQNDNEARLNHEEMPREIRQAFESAVEDRRQALASEHYGDA